MSVKNVCGWSRRRQRGEGEGGSKGVLGKFTIETKKLSRSTFWNKGVQGIMNKGENYENRRCKGGG